MSEKNTLGVLLRDAVSRCGELEDALKDAQQQNAQLAAMLREVLEMDMQAYGWVEREEITNRARALLREVEG